MHSCACYCLHLGQQLHGTAAKAIWVKTCDVFGGEDNLLPSSVLSLVGESKNGIESLKVPAGLSRAKANAIVDLASHFEEGKLSDEILMDPTIADNELKSKLLALKGIGEWTFTMFAIFELHKPDLLAVGDLGVRRSIAKIFSIRGSGRKGLLHENNDRDRMMSITAPFAPYRSLFTWYMWRETDVITPFHDTRDNVVS